MNFKSVANSDNAQQQKMNVLTKKSLFSQFCLVILPLYNSEHMISVKCLLGPISI